MDRRGGLTFHVLFFDYDFVVEPALRTEHLRDRLSNQREIMLLKPLIVELARKLNREFSKAAVLDQSDRSEGLKPGLKTLSADVVPYDVETPIPDQRR
jgi:hypothetical protein